MLKRFFELPSLEHSLPFAYMLASFAIGIMSLIAYPCFSQHGKVPPPPKPGMTIPDPLDVCHDSVERIATLLRRFPQLAKEGSPLMEVLSCEEMASNSNEPYSMDSARKYQIVELLLKYGAEPNYALGQCRDSAIAELLIRNGAKVDEEYGRELKSTLTEELEYLANPAGSLRGKLVKGTGHTVLFEVSSDWPGWSGGSRGSPWSFDAATSDSITGRRLGFMTVLLTHGAKPNANNASMLINLIRNISARWENDEASYQGDTIHLLCLNLVKILVEAGAEVNISYHDVTPLLAAVESHWPAAVDY